MRRGVWRQQGRSARSIGRAAAGIVLAAGLGSFAPRAAALPIPFLHHGKHGKAPEAPREGVWALGGQSLREVFVNPKKKPVQVILDVCVDARSGGQAAVDIEMPGRPAVEVRIGCQNLYLVVDAGEKIALFNPGPGDVSGTFKVAVQT